jgi:adenylate cyclase
VVAGPELHLNALNAVLQGAFLRETPQWVDFALIVASGVLAWLFGRFISHPLLRMALVVCTAVGWFFGAVALYNANWVAIVFSPMLALVSSASIFSIIEQVLERLEKGRLRRTFERYVSRDVVKELVDNPESFLNTVGGVRKSITVLFSDVRGFTTMTESADAGGIGGATQ